MRIKMSKMKEMTDNKKTIFVIIGKKNNQKSLPALSVYPWVGISLSASETEGSFYFSAPYAHDVKRYL